MRPEGVLLPFRFPGGKYYALGRLHPFWETVVHDEYREPFVGGGTVFFAKTPAKHNWLNDIDKTLMTTYHVLADPELRSKLLSLLGSEVASKERWREVKDIKPKNKLETAFRYYYLNRTSFSGKLSSPAWGYRPKRSLPPERWHERIIPCGKKLEGVKLTCLDFGEVIKAEAMGSKALMYVDPPYYSPPKNKHYVNGFSNDDHLRLCKLLSETDFKFFLTYDDVRELRDMYSWANLYEIDFFYRVDNSNFADKMRRRGRELVIANYKIPRGCKIDDFVASD